ncbi:MAG TPA: indolepyruvate ferredoxin oxidoreductase, partial [Methanosarcinales archaeon]|nr:indolepyruvate ferredoxin oxidoreductase [Methanosarcinales archaeon]
MVTTTPCIDAVTSAVHECKIKQITCVPGYPITRLAEHLMSGTDAEWCINEKVAMEIALGASAHGSRSMVIVKHVGMNILADPLVTASTHTTGAGVVVIAGDDPAAVASQNEQDSRYWGLLAEVPVLDPNPGNLHDAV